MRAVVVFFVAVLAATAPPSRAVEADLQVGPAPNQPCPVTNGSRDIVPPSPHIFGSGMVWFGDGPVYVNLAWKGDTLPPARFRFSSIPIYDGQPWPAKTPVVADPSYAGTIVMHGRSVRAPFAPLLFNGANGPVARLELTMPGYRPSPHDWSFWATGVIIPRAGCYELRIDTAGKTERIVFEAAP